MKHIIKNKPPESLETYKTTEGACFNNLPKNVKEELRDSLIREQGWLCCYCGKRINPDYHSVIEHLLPKGLKQYSNLQLEYKNLLCSCDGGESNRTGKTKEQKKVFPPYCDSKKNNKVIKISPLDEDCEDYFFYDEDGHIYGSTDDAKGTIDTLGLDCSTLVSLRRAAIAEYKDMQYREEQWRKEIEKLESRHEGQFLPFCFDVIDYIQKYKLSISS